MKATTSLQLRKVVTTYSVLPVLLLPFAAHGQFAMNFQPVTAADGTTYNTIVSIDCRDPEVIDRCVRGDSIRDPDTTPFLQEMMIGSDGERYYHVIIGDQADGFVMEFYIRAHAGRGWYPGGLWNASGGAIYNGGTDTFSGKYAVDPLAPSYNKCSEQTAVDCSSFSNQEAADWEVMSTSGGSGSGNPERLIFRQIIEDPEMTQEVVKAQFAFKPKITQTVADSGMSSTFELDMSSLTYDDLTTGATIINQMTVQAPDIPYDYADTIEFDMAVDSQDSNAKAGAYTYTPGIAFRGAFGDYEYDESSWDFYGVDWSLYSHDTNIPNN